MTDDKISKEFEPDEIVQKTVNNNGQVYLGRDLGGKDVVVAYAVLEDQKMTDDIEEEADELLDQMEQAEVVTMEESMKEHNEMMREAFEVLQKEVQEADSDTDRIVIGSDEIVHIKEDSGEEEDENDN